MKRRRNGFSLIELLTAVAVIAILIGVTVIAYISISRGREKDQTRVSLQTLESMLAEYEQKGGNMTLIDNLVNQSLKNLNYPTNGPLPAPGGSVTQDGPGRNCEQVLMTRRILTLLTRDPGAKAMLDSFPKDRIDFDPVNGPVLLDGAGNPIIFCPRWGLSRVGLIKTNNNPVSFSMPNQTIYSPESMNGATGRPFFASAGPDAQFDWGDDNVYSFTR